MRTWLVAVMDRGGFAPDVDSIWLDYAPPGANDVESSPAMPITVTVRDQAGFRDEGRTTLVDGISERTTLRDLIRTRVRDEVARYNAGPTDVFDGLVMPDGAKATRRGYEMPRRRRIDWERQAERALEAFSTNGFFVLVDDKQVTDLDVELDLTPESDIRFVRLVQLVGG